MRILRHICAIPAFIAVAMCAGMAEAQIEVREFGGLSENSRWMLEADNRDQVLDLLHAWSDESVASEQNTPEFVETRAQVMELLSRGNAVSEIATIHDHLIWGEFADIYINGREEPLIALSSILEPPYVLNVFEVSPDGEQILVEVSRNGGEIGTVYIFQTRTGQLVTSIEQIELGSSSWLNDRYLLYSAPRMGPDGFQANTYAVSQYVYDLQSEVDIGPVFGADYEGIDLKQGAYPSIWAGDSKSDYALGYEWRGDNFRVFLTDQASLIAGQPYWRLISPSDHITDAELFGNYLTYVDRDEFGHQSVYIRDLSAPADHDQMIFQGSVEISPQYLLASVNTLYVVARHGAVHQIYRYDSDFALQEVTLPLDGSILLETVQTAHNGGLIFEMSSPEQRSVWIMVDEDDVSIILQDDTSHHDSEIEILTEYAVSADGAQIPLTIYRFEGDDMAGRSGIIEAYGSYGETQMAVWDILPELWLEDGGVYAICHVRGGGYYGRTWHFEGKGPDKSHSHDDLIACAEHLTGLTGEPSVGAIGGSAGGLVVGPAAISRPDLLSAVIMQYSWLNPTEFWSDVNGAAQIDEMGNPRNPEDYPAIAKSDSLLLLEAADQAPSAYLCLGQHDTRVSVWHSARYIQLMKERFPDTDVFVRLSDLAGHGCALGGEEVADVVASQMLWMKDQLSSARESRNRFAK